MLYSPLGGPKGLVASARRHGLDPNASLRDVLARISDHPSNRLEEFLPDHPGTVPTYIRMPWPAGWKLAHSTPPSQA